MTAPTPSGGPATTEPLPGQPVACEMSRFGVFLDCPQCGGDMAPEHAHYRCLACGYRDSCCM